jgi:hypothetical protein
MGRIPLNGVASLSSETRIPVHWVTKWDATPFKGMRPLSGDLDAAAVELDLGGGAGDQLARGVLANV